jgi:CDP-diacylglycerol--glycerol-3-phosphate 3-phosphatidyltransferase
MMPQRDLFRSLDLGCSLGIVLTGLAACALYGGVSMSRRIRGAPPESGRRARPRPWAHRAVLWLLAPVARALLALGVSANSITGTSLVLGAMAGLLLGSGHFGVAALLFVVASLGDALDGLVARTGHTDSASGALFDAVVDRYEEFFAFAGLAFFFRSSPFVLALTLGALAGCFMVSYGSAKAEARHVPVPGGPMRRPERATCIGAGAALAPIAGAVSARLGGPSWVEEAPLVLAIVIVAIMANVSAIQRLRTIASAPASLEHAATTADPSVARVSVI